MWGRYRGRRVDVYHYPNSLSGLSYYRTQHLRVGEIFHPLKRGRFRRDYYLRGRNVIRDLDSRWLFRVRFYTRKLTPQSRLRLAVPPCLPPDQATTNKT